MLILNALIVIYAERLRRTYLPVLKTEVIVMFTLNRLRRVILHNVWKLFKDAQLKQSVMMDRK